LTLKDKQKIIGIVCSFCGQIHKMLPGGDRKIWAALAVRGYLCDW